MGKKMTKNLNLIVLTCGVIAVAVILNVILELLPLDIDLTTEKLYTLTETTEKVLDELNRDVTIYALYDEVAGAEDSSQGGKAEVMKVLEKYENKSKHIDVKYVDLDKNPSFLKNLVGESNTNAYDRGDYVVVCGDNVRRIDESDMYSNVTQTYNTFYEYKITNGLQAETKLTSAILKVTGDVPVIYYSVGFGETNISRYSILVSYLEDSGFDFLELDVKTGAIPENCACLMFFGPTEDLTDSAYDRIERWMKTGGNAFFFMDVKSITDDHYIYKKFDNFNKLFSNYGISLENTIVSESDDYQMTDTGEDSVFSSTVKIAGALERLNEKFSINILNTRSLNIDTMNSAGEAEALIVTSTGAVAKSIESENDNRKGESVIAASGKCAEGTGTSRICVFGSSQTFCDLALKFYGTANPEKIMTTSLEWMDLQSNTNVGDSIEVKKYNSNITTIMQTSAKQAKTIVIITMVIIPLIILAVGVAVFIRRRHL